MTFFIISLILLLEKPHSNLRGKCASSLLYDMVSNTSKQKIITPPETSSEWDCEARRQNEHSF